MVYIQVFKQGTSFYHDLKAVNIEIICIFNTIHVFACLNCLAHFLQLAEFMDKFIYCLTVAIWSWDKLIIFLFLRNYKNKKISLHFFFEGLLLNHLGRRIWHESNHLYSELGCYSLLLHLSDIWSLKYSPSLLSLRLKCILVAFQFL